MRFFFFCFGSRIQWYSKEMRFLIIDLYFYIKQLKHLLHAIKISLQKPVTRMTSQNSSLVSYKYINLYTLSRLFLVYTFSHSSFLSKMWYEILKDYPASEETLPQEITVELAPVFNDIRTLTTLNYSCPNLPKVKPIRNELVSRSWDNRKAQ